MAYMKIGELCLQFGLLTEEQLLYALDEHRKRRNEGLFGKLLNVLGLVQERDITDVLRLQKFMRSSPRAVDAERRRSIRLWITNTPAQNIVAINVVPGPGHEFENRICPSTLLDISLSGIRLTTTNVWEESDTAFEDLDFNPIGIDGILPAAPESESAPMYVENADFFRCILSRGNHVKLQISWPQKQEGLEIMAKIAWIRSQGKSKPVLLGLRFEEFDEQVKRGLIGDIFRAVAAAVA